MSSFLSSDIQSQPNKPILPGSDSLEINNANDVKVIPLMIWTEDRNPIKQVLGIDFGKLKIGRRNNNDSLSLISMGIKLTDTVRQINTLNDLIKTFKEIFNNAFDTLITPQDSSGSFEEEFHFVSLEPGLAMATFLPRYQINLMIRRRKDQ